MFETYYQITFILSLVLSGVYMFIWHRNYDSHLTLIFLLIPISNLGFLLQSQTVTEEAALLSTKFFYMGGCYLQMIIMLAVFSLCQIRLNRWIRIFFMLASTFVYLSILSIGNRPWFYKDVYFEKTENAVILMKDYGIMHTVFRLLVITYLILSFCAIGYAFLRKNQVSRKILILLFIPEAVCVFCYLAGKRIVPNLELLPAGFCFAQLVYLTIVYQLSLYDVIETAVETMAQSGSAGFITFDMDRDYLGSNETAKQIFPGLETLTVDLSLSRDPYLSELITPWLDSFEAAPDQKTENIHHYEKDGKVYEISVEWLTDSRNNRRGYELFITDDTLDQAYIRLLDGYNTDLSREVARKTEHILRMHDNLILSMATMVESRDNSTGGHIRRTSEGVRILIDAMKELPISPEGYSLTDDFCHDLIKAAPMHDLGKIAVDDAVLRKPGRFTQEEFEKMKTHAAEGARIVHEILKSTDDIEFHHLAENVAHYHHERWDGSGYPDHLAGAEIPPEARIMAIADVYDALVSKRVYKDSMSFEKADTIIMSGMGSQFDPALEVVYLAAKPALEAYYSESPA